MRTNKYIYTNMEKFIFNALKILIFLIPTVFAAICMIILWLNSTLSIYYLITITVIVCLLDFFCTALIVALLSPIKLEDGF